MGLYCCKSEEEEVTEQDDYNKNTYGNTYTYTYNQNNNEDIFKTRAPCLYGHYCPCACHNQSGGSCIFKLKAK